jgi:beta-galactosidase GanA
MHPPSLGVYALFVPFVQGAVREKSLWSSGIHLAVDYYPSQWPEWMWEADVARMRDSNISFVRVNEFDWSVLEPKEGEYNFTLLDTTLDLFDKYGLKAIIGTPTAAPPNWLTDKYDISFVDRTNATLLFGSRRHYSFSSFDYREQSQKITRKLAQRYGNHSSVVAWQLDNELGCHDTVRSYDQNAKTRFRAWLQHKYGTIEHLNERQGRVFWSSQYASFAAVEPPFLEIYTPNPAHTLDWYRFSSDMLIDFAREQAVILRQYAPSHALTTNFMVFFTDFDHHKFAREVGIDIAAFDEYPLAGTSALPLSDSDLEAYLRTGEPDLQALHHALYRGISGAAFGRTHGPFGVMEMQPGVLNWNAYRVSPVAGMVRLWTHEVFAAEGGGLVGYFRWRQLPYAQEQTLSGLFLSDGGVDEGFGEVEGFVRRDLPVLRAYEGEGGEREEEDEVLSEAEDPQQQQQHHQADVALIFDYPSHWVWAIEPHSGVWSVKDASYTNPTLTYTTLVHTFYAALRRLGLSVDILSPEQFHNAVKDNNNKHKYKMLVVPSLPIIPPAFEAALADFDGAVVLGPHTGSRTADFTYVPGLGLGGPPPGPLPPAAGAGAAGASSSSSSSSILTTRLPLRVTRIETPPVYARSGVSYAGVAYDISSWEEGIVCPASTTGTGIGINTTNTTTNTNTTTTAITTTATTAATTIPVPIPSSSIPSQRRSQTSPTSVSKVRGTRRHPLLPPLLAQLEPLMRQAVWTWFE